MKKMLISLSLLITIFSINMDTRAAINTALINGNWNSPFTWSSGIPSCGDTIIIPPNTIVKITANVDLDIPGDPLCLAVQINIYGSLRFDNGRKLKLAKGACINVEMGGSVSPSAKGGGGSESIYFGDTREWLAADGNLVGPTSVGCQVLLPVELVNFDIKQLRNKIWELNWTVASEVNVLYYSISYSDDGLVWNELKNIPIQSNDAVMKDYNEQIELNPKESTFYIRLLNHDFDGNSKILSVKSLQSDNQNVNFKVFPNPQIQGQDISIYFENENNSETIDIKIWNSTGKCIYQNTLINSESVIIIPTITFEKGTYFIQQTVANSSKMNKCILL
ncbi:MAG: T9SS type A sorting domain-containing protein [Flavobacteriia bacterium]|nr:T9SS type A sorting domain-containing protein [Flavobacteriia bacterium]